MTKLPLSATATPAIALFAKNYETNEPFCQAVEQRMFVALGQPSGASGSRRESSSAAVRWPVAPVR